MRVESNFFCTVPMPDAGDPSIPATARRFGNDSVIECYKNLVEWAKTADQLGFDTMWLTEHHFEYEGYEVLPNLIMFGQHLAGVTTDLPGLTRDEMNEQMHPRGRRGVPAPRRTDRAPAHQRPPDGVSVRAR